MHLVLIFLYTQLYYLTYYYNSGLFMFQMCKKNEKETVAYSVCHHSAFSH